MKTWFISFSISPISREPSSVEDQLQHRTYGYSDLFNGGWWSRGTKGHREPGRGIMRSTPAAAEPVQKHGHAFHDYRGMDNPSYDYGCRHWSTDA